MNHTSWVSPKIEIRETTSIGLGTFAKEAIKKGEIVIVQGGRMLSGRELDKPEFESIWYHAFQVEKDVYICPLNLDSKTFDGIFKVNHSCEPTCGFKGQVTMVSMRDVSPGEQITFDYAMSDVGIEEEDWKAMKCLCGSKICRGTIGGDDWKLSDLRERYKGFFSPYVQELIDKGQ